MVAEGVQVALQNGGGLDAPLNGGREESRGAGGCLQSAAAEAVPGFPRVGFHGYQLGLDHLVEGRGLGPEDEVGDGMPGRMAVVKVRS